MENFAVIYCQRFSNCSLWLWDRTFSSRLRPRINNFLQRGLENVFDGQDEDLFNCTMKCIVRMNIAGWLSWMKTTDVCFGRLMLLVDGQTDFLTTIGWPYLRHEAQCAAQDALDFAGRTEVLEELEWPASDDWCCYDGFQLWKFNFRNFFGVFDAVLNWCQESWTVPSEVVLLQLLR